MKTKILATNCAKILAVGLVLLSVAGCQIFGYKMTRLESDSGIMYSEVISYAGSQAHAAWVKLNGGFPAYTEDGEWVTTEKASWAYGYYPGLAWLLYQSTRDNNYYELAQNWTASLEERRNDVSGIGLGQVFYPTHVVGYQVTGNRHLRDVAIEAANSLAERSNQAGFIPAWGEPQDTVLGRRLSIETMMNLDLLFWANKATGDPNFAAVADKHALFTLRHLVGDDGKILHMADFYPNTGLPFNAKHPLLSEDKKYSPKGYSPGTAWALGQAWAVHGFTSTYRHTGNTVYLNAAKRTADYFLANLPADGVALWDFELPQDEKKQKDTAATAVAAAALLKLSRLCPSVSDRLRYRAAAEKMVEALSQRFMKRGSLRGLLGEAVYDKNQGLGVGGSTAWGDYYYIEALLILRDYRA
jgi:unsaturated chondroitin disaccharide hydrolase